MEKIFVEGKWRKLFANKGGYLRFNLKGKLKTLHRYLYEQYHQCSILPGVHVHHIDENKQNNAINNLELITASEHTRMHIIGKKRKFKGGSVSWNKKHKKWHALVYENNKLKHLGYFPAKLEAFQALYKYYPEYWNVYRQAENYVKNIYDWGADE